MTKPFRIKSANSAQVTTSIRISLDHARRAAKDHRPGSQRSLEQRNDKIEGIESVRTAKQAIQRISQYPGDESVSAHLGTSEPPAPIARPSRERGEQYHHSL